MKMFIYFIVFAVFFFVYIRCLENNSIFYPVKEIRFTPAQMGLPFEDVFIKTEDDVLIHGWLVKSPLEKGTLLFFHGNAGNIGDRLEKIRLFNGMGLNVLIIDYRGYGKSQGKPSENGIYRDAVAAYDYLAARGDIKPERIIGYGASLGGAVAVDLAARRDLACLIVDSSFTNAADMAKTIYPFIPSFFVRAKLDSLRKVRGVTVPKLFIHSREDDIVPFKLGDKLFRSAADPKEFLEITGGHNDGHIESQKIMVEGVNRFLDKCLAYL